MFTIKIKYNLDYKKTLISKSFKKINDYDKVVYMDCSYNRLTSLPKLPNSLQTLWCQNNQLTSLPKLPNSFQTLWCQHNQLTSFPEFPNSLQKLFCWDNQLITKLKYKYSQKIINM
jgi:Leucine-rich repeat (LRR) protein